MWEHWVHQSENGWGFLKLGRGDRIWNYSRSQQWDQFIVCINKFDFKYLALHFFPPKLSLCVCGPTSTCRPWCASDPISQRPSLSWLCPSLSSAEIQPPILLAVLWWAFASPFSLWRSGCLGSTVVQRRAANSQELAAKVARMLESPAAVWEPRSHRRSAEMRIQTSSERKGAVALGIPAWEPTSSIRATSEGSFQSWDRLIVLATLVMP